MTAERLGSASLASLSSIEYLPPWSSPHIIGIGGSSGSGKTSVASQIMKYLKVPWAVILSFDNFYKPLSPEESKRAFDNNYDFDSPEALDLDYLVEVLTQLRRGKKAEIPVYSFSKHNRTDTTVTIYGASVIILEGIFTLYDQRILDLLDLKVFVDTAPDICMARRLSRDIVHRGRDLEGAMQQWFRFVKPNYDRYVKPTMANADIVVPRGLDNTVAIYMVLRYVQRTLVAKSQAHVKHLDKFKSINESESGESDGDDDDSHTLDNVLVLDQTPQIKAIHTILFDRTTSKEDFIFYFERVATILIENALNFLPYKRRVIMTPCGLQYSGLETCIDTCAVEIMRAGACFENSLRKNLPEVAIGKILIQSDARSGEPFLHYLKLPNVENKFVFLLDTQATSGAAAIMAIRVLLDHSVQQDHICFVTYVADRRFALRRILSAFPKVKIVAGKIEDDVRRRFIDLRYFGS
ncbi:uridine kinase family-domain-containing protein [Dipodascopsis uninucleata]